MEYARLGKSNLKVSRLGLGGWQFGKEPWGLTDKDVIRKIINTAIDLGINFIDTAESYGEGFSERVIGEVIRERGDRENLVIATKVSSWHLSYKDVLKACNKSLERLGFKYIDLYQVHWPNMYTPVKETMSALERLVDEGKVRYIGLSNFPPCLIREAVASLKKYEIISNQVVYSIIERTIEVEILPTMRELGIITIAYSPLCMGLLTGKYDEKTVFPKEDIRSWYPLFAIKSNYTQALKIVEMLKDLAKKYNKEVPQIALNWLLKHDDVFPIFGAKKPEHVKINVGATGWRLSEEDWRKIEEASSKLDITFIED